MNFKGLPKHFLQVSLSLVQHQRLESTGCRQRTSSSLSSQPMHPLWTVAVSRPSIMHQCYLFTIIAKVLYHIRYNRHFNCSQCCLCTQLTLVSHSNAIVFTALPVLPFDNPNYLFQNAYEATAPCNGTNVACCGGVGHTMLNNATTYDGYTLDYNSDGFSFFSLNATVRYLRLYHAWASINHIVRCWIPISWLLLLKE